MEPTVLQVLAGLALAAILAFIGLVLSQKSQLVRIETLLTGADGSNGLVGDIKQLKAWRSEVEEYGLPRRVESLELDRRHGPEDRRVSA